MTVRETLFQQEQEWRKHSVYPLRDDSDRDFEFYVFVDPGQGKTRPLFLEVLEQAITDANAKLDGEPLKQFKEWTGTDDGNLATAMNWVKIAIERYPMRLFVVRDAVPNSNPHLFLKKRICWLTRSEFEEQLNGDKEQFKLWLHAQWVKHLIANVRADLASKTRDTLQFEFRNLQLSDALTHEISTLPEWLRVPQSRGQQPCPFPLDLNSLAITKNAQNNVITVVFQRHSSCYKWSSDKWQGVNQLDYCESFSGALSYASMLMEAAASPNEHRSFLLRLAETALLRIGIADERFQEWWEKHETEIIGSLLSQKVIAVFWGDNPEKTGQRSFPNHGAYAVYKPKGQQEQLTMTVPGQDSPNPWESNSRSLDILVVHQGILDKWDSEASKEQFTQKVLEWKKDFAWIVVTSGRGRPDAVPYGVKFLPWAGVDTCMVGKYFEKLTLMQQIAVIMEEIEAR